ncbi:MAG: hypothetical protein Q7S11_00335 [bacterium]|nr:hypothetical protein [bacterium]
MIQATHKDNTKTSLNHGGALILGLMIASILLSVGMGISNIALKEIKLSSIGNKSGIAFYMADTGIECALYWDSQSTTTVDRIDDGIANNSAAYVFATSSVSGSYPNPNTHRIKCFDGVDITGGTDSGKPQWSLVYGAGPSATTTFELRDPTNDTKPCVVVAVGKRDNGSGAFFTTIDSRGRSSCDSTDLRRVERGLKVFY